ncbi:MAG TPA: DJ-1/PfpI family protein, partial [Pyrinomonadaceae bacterium]|nr:DJ-1/PfpI family protein [Pyrinomonadaceae bacterium]
EPSPALRMIDNPNFKLKTIKTRKIAFLMADGFNDNSVAEMKMSLMKAGAKVLTVAPRLGLLTGREGDTVNADFSFLTGASVLFDAFYVPDGETSVSALQAEPEAINFLNEAYKHCKTIAASGAGVALLESAGLDESLTDAGLIFARDVHPATLAENFVMAIAQHRHWGREPKV